MEQQMNGFGQSGRGLIFHGTRATFDFEQQCLRVLRCTALALANSPGGLRFKAGSRPWLEALRESKSELQLSLSTGV